jgi:endoglucanase
MKLKNIINTMSLAAVALFTTACQDTDAQYEIPVVGAPDFVSITPADGALVYGEKTITVTFDKNINFMTKNAEKITLNGVPVKKALVLGASNTLTITVDVDFNKEQTLIIPAGLITGPQGDAYDEEIIMTWKINDLPSNTATELTKKLGWGWNLGNHFDTSGDAISKGWGYWDQVGILTAAPFQTLASAGAKTVRIPTTWTDHMDDNYVINAAYLDEVAGVVDKVIAAGMNAILNTHHDSFETDLGNAATNEETAKKDSTIIAELWKQVATRFASYNEKLIFETFNEIHAGDNWSSGTDAEYELLNKWNQYAVDAIRKTGGNNATRWIGVAGYAANIDMTIQHLVLPNDPANKLMVSVHCYDPYNFCTQPYASGDVAPMWGHTSDASGAEELAVINQLYKLRAAYIENNIPCYLGEYGCVYRKTDAENAFRAYYLEFFCRAANLAGIPMFIWDNNTKTTGNEGESFGYIDHANGAWLNDSETLVPTMIKACTSTDSSYSLQTIWNKAPAAY